MPHSSLRRHPERSEGSRLDGAVTGDRSLALKLLAALGSEEDHRESAMATLQAKGVRVPPEIKEDHGIRLAYFADPDGMPLYLARMVRGGGPEGWN